MVLSELTDGGSERQPWLPVLWAEAHRVEIWAFLTHVCYSGQIHCMGYFLECTQNGAQHDQDLDPTNSSSTQKPGWLFSSKKLIWPCHSPIKTTTNLWLPIPVPNTDSQTFLQFSVICLFSSNCKEQWTWISLLQEWNSFEASCPVWKIHIDFMF